MGQLEAVQRARELLLLDHPADVIALDLESRFGVGRVDALAAILVARAFNRAA